VAAATVTVRWLTSGVYQVSRELGDMQTYIGVRGETLDVPAGIAGGMIAAGIVVPVAATPPAPAKKRRKSA
jgi:hypothetical protein